jgi:hypothetical protein
MGAHTDEVPQYPIAAVDPRRVGLCGGLPWPATENRHLPHARVGGSLRLYTELPVDCDFQQVAMSGDARQFVCAVERSQPDVWMVQNFDLDRQ